MYTYTLTEIAVYTYVLQHVGTTAAQAAASLGMSPEAAANTLSVLERSALVDSWVVDGEGRRPPKHYEAVRGIEPLEIVRAEREAEAQRKLASTRGLKSPVQYSRAPGSSMSRAELEVLVINFELSYPGEAWRVIEHYARDRQRRGLPPLLDAQDYPGLQERAQRR